MTTLRLPVVSAAATAVGTPRADTPRARVPLRHAQAGAGTAHQDGSSEPRPAATFTSILNGIAI